MARIPIGDDGIEWQITTLAYDVVLIKNPGFDTEEIPIRFDGRLPLNYSDAKKKLIEIKGLDLKQNFEGHLEQKEAYKMATRA